MPITTPKPKLTFEPSVETLQIVEHLAAMCVEETVTYDNLDTLTGLDVRATGRLQSARRIIERESQMVFGVIRGLSIQRLDDAQIVNTADDRRNRIRRAAYRGRKTLSCAEFKNLNREERIKHTVSIMLLTQLQKVAGTPALTRATKEFTVSEDAMKQMAAVQ